MENEITMENTNNEVSSCNDQFMSNEIDKIAVALSKAQAAIENVGKDKQGYGYKYADLASCLEAIKIPLSKNGLSITQPISQLKDGGHILITLLIHESGQWLKSMLSIEKVVMKNKQGTITGNTLQHLGSGITYARRYALSSIIGLAQEDNDAQSIRREGKEKAVEASVIKEFIELCAEHKVDAKEFAHFHNIDSQKPETVNKAIANFVSLKEEFLTELSNPKGEIK